MLDDVLNAFRAGRHLFRASRAKPRLVSEAKPGELVRVDGTVVIDDAELMAPFTRAPCVLFKARLEAKYESSEEPGGILWRDAFVVTEHLSFWLVDDRGGRVRLRREPAHVDLQEANVSEVPTVNDENPELARLLRSQGVVPFLYMGIAGDHRFHEARVAVGDRVSIFGRLVTASQTAAAGYRDAPLTIAELAGTNLEPLVVKRNG